MGPIMDLAPAVTVSVLSPVALTPIASPPIRSAPRAAPAVAGRRSKAGRSASWPPGSSAIGTKRTYRSGPGFWAPRCAPCRATEPVFEAAGRELEPWFRLLEVNTDDAPQLAARHAIYGLPTFALFSRGREVAPVTGALPAPD